LLWRPATALVNELPPVTLNTGCYEAARFPELLFVPGSVSHRLRNAVGGKQERGDPAAFGWDLLERLPGSFDHRLDEAGVIEKRAKLLNLRHAVADVGLSSSDVLTVLPAAGVRTVRAGNERQRMLDSVGLHLAERVREQRVPVAVAPVNRQSRPMFGQLRFESSNQCSVLIVDRTAAAEVVVMLGYFQHPLARHIAATQDVFEKRQHIIRPVRAAERNYQNCVVRRRHRFGSYVLYNLCRQFYGGRRAD
jgi:hypothetical protein